MTDDLTKGQTVFIISSVVLGVLSLLIFSLLYLAISWGITTAFLWNWFIAKQFGLQPMSIPVAVGINLLLSNVTRRPETKEEKDKSKALGQAISQLLFPWFILLCGWVVSWFI